MFWSPVPLRQAQWRGDLVAGLTLAAIAIPEQMATARLGGFPPHVGFIAFIAGSLAFALLGSSRVVSVGADSTIAPIFAGALGLIAASGTPQYHALASLLALFVGVALITASMLRAGSIADLLSIPVLTGFLAGISIHIALSQAPAFFGLPSGPEAPLPKLAALIRDLSHPNWPTTLIGVACLSLIVLTERLSPRIPGALIALAAAAWVGAHFSLRAKGVVVLGNIAHATPHLAVPAFSPTDLSHVIGLAIIVSLVVMVQTGATSRAFPTQGDAPNVDRDFLGVGAGSLLSGLFGAFPVNASPPRTAIVAESGGASQLAGLAAAAIVAAILFYGGAVLAQIPEAALAAVLLFVAGRLFRWRDMVAILRTTRAEFALVVVTMLAVVLLPIQTGVGLAIILSLLHGVWTTTRTRLIEMDRIPGTTVWWPASEAIAGERVPGLLVVAFQAPLSFLNADLFQRDLAAVVDRADRQIKLVVLEASSIVEIDYSAALALAKAIINCRERGIEFAVARLESVRGREAFDRFGVTAGLGSDRLFHSVDEATRALIAPLTEAG
jgi:SulP family sulfate permease